MLHDGSEYRGNYGVSADTLRDFHAPRLQLFDASNADVLAIETIPSVVEARVLAELLADCDLPAWISFSCKDETHLVDGTPVAEVAGQFRNHPAVARVDSQDQGGCSRQGCRGLSEFRGDIQCRGQRLVRNRDAG
jgi:homocysteine S-methyltransferase